MKRRRYLAPWGRAAVAARALAPGGSTKEVLAALEGKPALYHCVSRVVDRTFRFGPAEKEEFVRRMRALEAFCQVRVLTFCVMSNHFHVLVEVPERPEREPTDAELVAHLGTLYGAQRLAEIRWQLQHFRSQGNHAAAEALRQRFQRRMWDLSVFLRELKQGFSRWFNGQHARRGYLWEDRFRSVLVEDGHAARVIAAYIDLNPVRAGLASAPEDYRWNGYGEAVAGRQKARDGLRQVMLERELNRSNPSCAVGDRPDWGAVLAEYRRLMEEDAARSTGRVPSVAGEPSAAKRAVRLSEAEMLRRRVRYFVDGLAIGTRGFVDGVFELTRERFPAGRTSGARRMGRADTRLRSMRALRVDTLG